MIALIWDVGVRSVLESASLSTIRVIGSSSQAVRSALSLTPQHLLLPPGLLSPLADLLLSLFFLLTKQLLL